MVIRIKMPNIERTISLDKMTDESFNREMVHISGCSFKPCSIAKVDGISYSDATCGIEPENMHIHFGSYMFHFYIFLKNKEDYCILKNNVLKEKLKV